MKLNLDFTLYKGKTRLKHWWPKVKEHFTRVQTEHNALEDTVNSHKTASELDHPSKSVKQRHIADKAVGQGQIADYAVGQGQLAQYAVSSAKIYPGAVQTAHIKAGIVTREKLSEDITAELDKITPTQQKLDEEITKLRATDATLATRITDEAMDRIDGDDGVRNNIEQQLYNKNAWHTFKAVLPIGIPQLYFADGQEYEGEYLRMPDLDIKLYFDGKLLVDTVLMTKPINIPVNRSDSYVDITYFFDDASVYFSASENPVQAYMNKESVRIPLYHYENINLDFWPADNSPTGDYYAIEGYSSEYSSENADKAGVTYTAEQGYCEATGNSLANLKTDSKTSFLDAVNELSDKVDTLENTSAVRKDLYGDAVEQTASLEIVIKSEELSQHITRVTTNYLETDILEVLGDIVFDIDDHSVFNTANTSDLKSWNINSKFKIYETPDYQPIAICFDIDKKKVWVEKTDDNSYDNGVFKFYIASIEHPQFFPNGDGRYTVDYSYLFINGALGYARTTLTFNDIRSRWQIEMGSNFLEAVNNNTARLDSKVDKVAGKGLSTNDYTNADKAKLAGIEEMISNEVVTTNRLADDAVTTEKIANDSVTNIKIADRSVDTFKLAEDAVYSNNIRNGSITTDKLGDYCITTDKLAFMAVTEDKLADETVTESKLSSDLQDKINNISQITVDTSISSSSENPVQNKAVYTRCNELETSISAIRAAIQTLAGELEIVTDTLPQAECNTEYSASLEAKGGIPPYTWTYTGGLKPQGIVINSDGTVTGTPTQSGMYKTIKIKCTDSFGNSKSKTISLTIM